MEFVHQFYNLGPPRCILGLGSFRQVPQRSGDGDPWAWATASITFPQHFEQRTMKIMKHSCIDWMWLKVDDPKNGWSSSCSKPQIIVPPQQVEPDFQDGIDMYIDDLPQKFPTQLSAFCSRQVHSNALCHTDIYTCLAH
jgi:hypothetical protein